MRARVRLLAVVALSLATVVAALVAPSSSSVSARDTDSVASTSARVANAAVAIRSDRAPRDTPPRLPVPPGAVAAFAVVASSLLVGRRRRRVGDVGDDWRGLLIGAPPALV